MAKHINEKKANGEWAPICNAQVPYGFDITPCAECAAIDATRPKIAAPAISQDELDRKMAKAGFEAAGNAGGLWNKLNPIKGKNF